MQDNKQVKVRVFLTPSCPYCVTLKQFLEKYNIKFEDIDVSQNEAAMDEMIEKSGQMQVPVVDIGGKFILGFDKKEITKLLNIKE